MTSTLLPILVGTLLALLQILAALPWLVAAFVTHTQWASWRRQPFAAWWLPRILFVLAVAVIAPFVFNLFVQGKDALEALGQVYGAVLQIQLTADFFVLCFAALLIVWPKGGAVALAAFREGIRQPMFWLLVGFALLLMIFSLVVPYFTFGEDHIMMKELGFDTIMLAAILFGALAASLFVTDEIEGRTAITLMSKPVSRRQFLLGKFVGILLTTLVMIGLLGWCFEGLILEKRWLERLDPLPPAEWVVHSLTWLNLPAAPTNFLRGIGFWTAHTLETLPGLALSFSQVMVLLAIAVALATRLPMVVNLSTVVVIYFLANLAPVLLSKAQLAQAANPDDTVPKMLTFMAKVFDTLLPSLSLFQVSHPLVSDMPLPMGSLFFYIGKVIAYGLIYTFIVLLAGLILFEDRDLA